MKITEKRYITACELRSLCIENNWYTRGDNEEYEAMFNKNYDEDGCPVNLTAEKLYEIASDIYQHSEIDDYSVETVMYLIARKAMYLFEVEK